MRTPSRWASTALAGADFIRPYVAELGEISSAFVSAYPNAGLPNAFGEFDEKPATTAALLREFAESGLVNIVGGCCGTTPDHIRAIAEAVAGIAPRPLPQPEPLTRFSGLETLTIREDSNFQLVGERTNVTGSARFRKLITAGDYDAAVGVALEQVRGGANILDVNMDEGMLDSEQCMTRFLNRIAVEPEIARIPIMVDSSKWSVLEAGLKCVQGKGIVNSLSLKEGEEEFLARARLLRRYGAGVVVMAFDEKGQADSIDRKVEICRARLRAPDREARLPARGHHLRSEHPGHRHRHRGARRLRAELHRGDPADQGALPSSPGQRRGLQPLVLLSAATTASARPSTRPSSITPSPPGWTWAS